jgi:hypothetical protein
VSEANAASQAARPFAEQRSEVGANAPTAPEPRPLPPAFRERHLRTDLTALLRNVFEMQSGGKSRPIV